MAEAEAGAMGVHAFGVHRLLYSAVTAVNMSVLTGPYLYKCTAYTVHCTSAVITVNTSVLAGTHVYRCTMYVVHCTVQCLL